MRFISELITATKTYWNVLYLALFVAACILILIFEKNKQNKKTFVWYSALILIFIYNPVTYLGMKYLLKDATTFSSYYIRFYNLIPVFAIIAYGITLVLSKLKGFVKLGATFACILAIALTGNCIYSESWFNAGTNPEKVPDDVLEITELFQETLDDGNSVCVMAPVDIAVYLRQVEGRITMPYSRYAPDQVDELMSEEPDAQEVLDYAAGAGANYIVSTKSNAARTLYRKQGFILFGETSNYMVFKTPSVKWVLTEYSDDSGLQGMFYTMQNVEDGTLIVIDGGSKDNESQVRKVIKEKGGEVDLWIITHYHADHVGAFNTIFNDPQGITINDVIASPVSSETYYAKAQEWDDLDEYENFLYAMEDAANLTYVNRGDYLTLFADLKITFYNSADEVNIDGEDVPNNIALVFKMETDNRSVLFCSDCHSEYITQYLMDTYGEELQADILQVGHHGNNSNPTETGWYELVNPSIALFDAPDWLMAGDDYTAKDLSEYLQNEGVKIYSFDSVPNTFAFY